MYRLLIVEDEPIEREALRLMLLNQCGDRFSVDTAENGFVAVEKARVYKPAVVMVDINMPGMNGLETIRELKKLYEDIHFLILSSYNQFEFAREAMKLGVEDFLLKPAKLLDLQQALEKILEKIEREKKNRTEAASMVTRLAEIRPVVESDCVYALIGKKEPEETAKIISFLGYQAERGFCFVMEYKKEQRFLLWRLKEALGDMGIHCIGEQLHNLLVFFVLGNERMEERKVREISRFLQMLQKERHWEPAAMGFGRLQTSLASFSLSYRQAVQALALGKEKQQLVCLYEEEEEKSGEKRYDLKEISGQLLEALERKEEGELEYALHVLLAGGFLEGGLLTEAREKVYQLLFLLMEEIGQRYRGLSGVIQSGFSMEEILKLEGEKELQVYLQLQLHGMLEMLRQYQKVNYNRIIQQALDYIGENYQQSMMLEDVAGYLRISPFYLSKLLKKHTGKNFTDLLAGKRIEQARILLAGPMSIKEVTFQVGFNSQNYFTKIFKKYTGMTPTEYKAQERQEI